MAQSGFAGKRCFLTGAASGIGRATALKLAAQGAELFLTDRDAEGLDDDRRRRPRARREGARAPRARHLRLRRGGRVRRRHPRRPPGDGRRDEHRRGVGVGHRQHARPTSTGSRWSTINLMGPIHVIETFVPPMVAGAPRRAPGQRVVGGRPGRAAVARGLQRQQVRPARAVSEVLRFDLARHRIGVSVVVPGAVKTPLVQTVRDRRRRPRAPAGAASGSTGSAGTPSRRSTSPTGSCAAWQRNRYLIYTSPDIRALYVFKRAGVVALQRRDATGERHLHPGAAAGRRGSALPIPGVSACPSPTAAWSAVVWPVDAGLAPLLVQLDLASASRRRRGVRASRASG